MHCFVCNTFIHFILVSQYCYTMILGEQLGSTSNLTTVKKKVKGMPLFDQNNLNSQLAQPAKQSKSPCGVYGVR